MELIPSLSAEKGSVKEFVSRVSKEPNELEATMT